MRHTLLRASPLVTLFTLVLFLPAVGSAQATDTFLRVPGIEGEATARGHEHWIDVSALRQALTPGWTTSSCTVDVVKGLDMAGPPLWSAAVLGQVFNEVTIEVARVGGIAAQTFYIIELRNARITGIVTTGAMPFAETVTFKAQNITLTYYPQDRDGTLGAPVSKTISCP